MAYTDDRTITFAVARDGASFTVEAKAIRLAEWVEAAAMSNREFIDAWVTRVDVDGARIDDLGMLFADDAGRIVLGYFNFLAESSTAPNG